MPAQMLGQAGASTVQHFPVSVPAIGSAQLAKIAPCVPVSAVDRGLAQTLSFLAYCLCFVFGGWGQGQKG